MTGIIFSEIIKPEDNILPVFSDMETERAADKNIMLNENKTAVTKF